MKTSIVLLCAAVIVAWPLGSFAQAERSLTREEVLQDLIRVEQAGYRPGWGDNTNYPGNILAAEARIAQQQAEAARNGYGVPASGAAQAGSPAPVAPERQ
jgi:DNA invertase Pin-like site-specific DNA recombinase